MYEKFPGEYYAERRVIWRRRRYYQDYSNVKLGYFAMTLVSLIAAAWCALWLVAFWGTLFFWCVAAPCTLLFICGIGGGWIESKRCRLVTDAR